jgi:DNA-binding NtrC family response regulator
MTTCADLADYIADCERVYIATVLTQHDWQMSKTAERLGISRKNLWEKMKKLGIHSPTAV